MSVRDLVARSERLAVLGRLSASIAHELNNPLSGIMGYAQLLRRGLADRPELLRDLDKIDKEIERLRRLTRSVLGFARPTAWGEVDLPDVVEMALGLVHGEARRRGASIVRELEAVPALRGDPGRLEQALLNLVMNALQALEGAPDPTVWVRARRDPERAQLVLDVEDNGSGIPAADLERVFEPGFTTKAASEGNGWGLAVVREAVEAHGGTVALSSRVGKGTIARVRLPIPRG